MTESTDNCRLSGLLDNDLETLVKMMEEGDETVLEVLEEQLLAIRVHAEDILQLDHHARTAKHSRTRLLCYCLSIVNKQKQ